MNNNDKIESLDFDMQEKSENDKFVKKQKIVRNEFSKTGKLGLPLIKKQNIDVDKIELWNFTKTKLDDVENSHKTIHFFTYDWHFDKVYYKPEVALEKLEQYYAILTPEFSTYKNMPLVLQAYSTFKNRWCGAYWQSMGKLVVPTIAWGTPASYEFCFDGVEQGSVVAVSTYTREDNKVAFLDGYNKMLEVIKPTAIICYGEPFSEMKGNIKAISPFDKDKLIAQLGFDEYAKRYIEGTLYPSN